MGVKTVITLDEINSILPSYSFIELLPTSSGIIDTTYIVSTKNKSYILKKYERDIPHKIEFDIKLLEKLKSYGLNTPAFIDTKDGWYLYEKLQGEQAKSISTSHIQELARFLAKLHTCTHKMLCETNIIDKDEIYELLQYTKSNFFIYFKKLEPLKEYDSQSNGLIHGDIFKDNTVFDGRKIGVFDFIDARCGGFSFDTAVALVGFGIKVNSHYYINLFLKSYNQKAPIKLRKKELLHSMKMAAYFYALKRIKQYKNTLKAKELLR